MESKLRLAIELVIIRYCDENNTHKCFESAEYYKNGGLYDHIKNIVEIVTEERNGNDTKYAV